MAAPKNNKYALGNNGGRPPVYANAVDLELKVIEYFTWIEGESHKEERTGLDEEREEETYEVVVWDRHPERPTITGLALFLGFDSKQSLYDYKKKEEFSYPIKRALTVIENTYENALDSRTPTGAIFALKNMDWIDKKELHNTHKFGIEADEEYVD